MYIYTSNSLMNNRYIRCRLKLIIKLEISHARRRWWGWLDPFKSEVLNPTIQKFTTSELRRGGVLRYGIVLNWILLHNVDCLFNRQPIQWYYLSCLWWYYYKLFLEMFLLYVTLWYTYIYISLYISLSLYISGWCLSRFITV